MDLKLSVCAKSNTVKNFIMATTVDNFTEIISFVNVSTLPHKIRGGLDVIFERYFQEHDKFYFPKTCTMSFLKFVFLPQRLKKQWIVRHWF